MYDSDDDDTGYVSFKDRRTARKAVLTPTSASTRPGLSDWNRLVRFSPDLAQRNGAALSRNLTFKQVRENTGWIVLKDKVYNISPYLPYHPGGDSILTKVMGKDVTKLFDYYHPDWVNETKLIGKLLVGYIDPSSKESDDEDEPI